MFSSKRRKFQGANFWANYRISQQKLENYVSRQELYYIEFHFFGENFWTSDVCDTLKRRKLDSKKISECTQPMPNVEKLLTIFYHRKNYHQPFHWLLILLTRSIRNYTKKRRGYLGPYWLPICAREQLAYWLVFPFFAHQVLIWKWNF